MLSVKSTERRYTKGVVYNGCIQICKNSEICTLFRIHDTLAQEWPILGQSLRTERTRSTVPGMTAIFIYSWDKLSAIRSVPISFDASTNGSLRKVCLCSVSYCCITASADNIHSNNTDPLDNGKIPSSTRTSISSSTL